MGKRPQIPAPDDLREYMRGPLAGLKSSYPGGIPELDLYPLIGALLDLVLTSRDVATILGHYFNTSYMEFQYEVTHLFPNRDVDTAEIERVIEKLRPHGYEEWRRRPIWEE